MAPKRKRQNIVATIIPPIDPNNHLPFAGNHMSIISEYDLLHLVEIGVLPRKELCTWRICRAVTVPTEDTHESVVYVPFLIHGLALPISPFFRGLLDFYKLNLTHLNPNSILQVAIFVHLCDAFLGILPHFGVWRYLYHCRPGMAGGQHQLVDGTSLELHGGRKVEYLDIPLKDPIKGWRLEWFIVENHGKSLPPRSRRQPDVRTPSWVESPTFLEITEAKVLLAEIYLLKDRGLTAEAVVADFVFKNIQPLKDRIYPAYLYTSISDSTRVTNRKIPNEDLLSRLDMILRGRVSNAGAPLAYSACNLPPNRPFSEFASNPPARDASSGHRVRPSPEDIKASIAPLRSLPEAERQTHFEMPDSTDDAEMDAVLSLLARESSDSTCTEPMAITTGQEFGKDVEIPKPEGAHRKRSRRVNRPAAPVEEKNKKRRLRRLSCLDQDAGPCMPILGDVLVDTIPEVNAGGCDDARAAGGVLDEDEEKEEEEIPLIHKNSRHYRGSDRGSDIPSQALSALVSLQGLSISDFDQTLEEVIPEDILLEPPEADISTICSEVPDGGLSLLDSAGQEVTRVVSRASSTLEGSLPCKNIDPSHPTPMEVAEGPSALEMAAAEDPAPEGGAGSDPAPEGGAGGNPAPEGVEACSLSTASMDVHIGSPPVRFEEVTVTHVSMTFTGQVALEVSELDARSLLPTGGAEVTQSCS
jgi:hypothetical protein